MFVGFWLHARCHESGKSQRKLLVSICRSSRLKPGHIRVGWSVNARTGPCYCARILPLMDFRMSIGEGEATRGTVVAARPVLENTFHHAHRKSGVIEASCVFIQQHKKPGGGWVKDGRR